MPAKGEQIWIGDEGPEIVINNVWSLFFAFAGD